jgi:hypothetical protein
MGVWVDVKRNTVARLAWLTGRVPTRQTGILARQGHDAALSKRPHPEQSSRLSAVVQSENDFFGFRA